MKRLLLLNLTFDSDRLGTSRCGARPRSADDTTSSANPLRETERLLIFRGQRDLGFDFLGHDQSLNLVVGCWWLVVRQKSCVTNHYSPTTNHSFPRLLHFHADSAGLEHFVHLREPQLLFPDQSEPLAGLTQFVTIVGPAMPEPAVPTAEENCPR